MCMCAITPTAYAGIGGGSSTGGGSTGKPSTGGSPSTGGRPSTGSRPSTTVGSSAKPSSTVSQKTGPSQNHDDPDEPADEDDPSGGGGGGGGGGGSVTNITNNYYYLDVGLQFKPRVGVITSINNSSDLIPMGSTRTDEDDICINPGTVWSPSSTEIPDITATIGRQYSYGVLYNGYWDTPLEGGSREMEIIEVDQSLNDQDSTAASVERSWANRDPGAVLSDDVGPESGGKEEFYSDYEKEIYRPVTEEPEWDFPKNWDSIISKAYCQKKGFEQNLGKERFIITPYTFKTWYTEEDTVKSMQTNANPSDFTFPLNGKKESDLTDAEKRALNILGYDILLRDEWVGSTTFKTSNDSPDYFGYTYSNTNVLDTRNVLSGNLLTADYVIQSIYRALGVNELRAQVYFYADKDLTVDFTPLAEKITVAMDKINQVQNRVDVFVTRANLGDYWDRAVKDNVVSNSGINVYNTVDAAYKPNARKFTEDTVDTETGLKYTKGTWCEQEYTGEAKSRTLQDVRIDYNRTKSLTLAEFCVYVKHLMDIYGEEVMTDKEQEMLLVYYGTKLPYNLENNEEFEAIKYLMAKGIVESDMYWDGALTLEDMLIILSRVKDEGSRLTFKELTLAYDENLLDRGYYPANINLTESPTINVVATTLNQSYNYANAEWFDYFLRMPKEITIGDKTYNPRFITKLGEQEVVTENLAIVQKDHSAEAGKDPYVHTDSSLLNFDALKVIGYEVLDDGYEYFHFKVKTSVLFKDGKLNDDYVKTDEGLIYINTNNGADQPTFWSVDYRGGIFKEPKGSLSTETRMLAKVSWSSSKYYSKGVSYSVSSGTTDLTDKHIDLNDVDSLEKANTCKSLVVSINPDGTVKDARTFIKKSGKDYSSRYLTFDRAGWDLKYCDYERYTTGYAVSLAKYPMLSETNAVDAIAKSIPKYDIWFYIPADKGNSAKLSVAVLVDGEEIISKDKPKEIKSLSTGKETGIKFLSYANGNYYYVAEGCRTEQGLSDMLKTSTGTSVNASYTTGYVKQNNTFLVKDTDLFALVEATSNVYTNGNIREITDGVICVSFDIKGSGELDQISHNIYLNEKLKLLSVNNMIYQIPDDEVLFVDNTKSGGSYLLNYRAVIGWGSGYVITSTDDSGNISVTVSSTSDYSSSFSYVPDGTYNSYTGNTTPAVFIKRDGRLFSVPASAPNNYASWFVYEGRGVGTYAVVLKGTDAGASDSVIAEMIKSPTDFEDVIARYKEGSKWVYDLFGVNIGTGNVASDKVLVTVYNLEQPGVDYVFNMTDSTDASKAGNKFYKDNMLGTWAYVPTNTAAPANPVNARLDMKIGRMPDIKTVTSQLAIDKKMHRDFYTGEVILPYYMDGLYTLIDISCNIHEDKPYGSIVGGSLQIADKSKIIDYSNRSQLVYVPSTDSSADCFSAYTEVVATTAPNPVPFIMGVEPVVLGKGNDKLSGNLRIAYGNYVYSYNPNATSNKLSSPGMQGLPDLLSEGAVVYVVGTSMLKQTGFLSVAGEIYSIDEEQRKLLIDKTTKSSLTELDQIGGVNWGAYTFDTLIHDVDNGLSILLIIVLNIIPRIGIFVFVILIGLSTVADMKPVRKFCDHVFDPYKLITLGHNTVYTIQTKVLLISSVIGLAAFALFMDGTIINLLTWLVQFVSAFVTR